MVYAVKTTLPSFVDEKRYRSGLYNKWSKDFMGAGKKRLAGDIVR